MTWAKGDTARQTSESSDSKAQNDSLKKYCQALFDGE